MNKQYVFTAPDLEKCKRFGIKFDGLCQRISLWMMGVASGVSYASGGHFKVVLADRSKIIVETNSSTVLNNVTDHVEGYGFTCKPHIPNCPYCQGERELAGNGGYHCFFCGATTT